MQRIGQIYSRGFYKMKYNDIKNNSFAASAQLAYKNIRQNKTGIYIKNGYNECSENPILSLTESFKKIADSAKKALQNFRMV